MAISRGVTLILIFSLLTTVRSWNNDILADGFRWSGCSALEPGTKMRHECNCEYYYTCTTNDILLLSRCRNGTTFDPLAKSCVYEWSSGCKSDNCNIDEASTCDPINAGKLYPHQCDCSKFYLCDLNGELYLHQCDNGLSFDKIARECKWNSDSTACYRYRMIKPYRAHLAIHGTINKRLWECVRMGTVVPHECRCDKYYVCHEKNRKALRECPTGQMFDRTLTEYRSDAVYCIDDIDDLCAANIKTAIGVTSVPTNIVSTTVASTTADVTTTSSENVTVANTTNETTKMPVLGPIRAVKFPYQRNKTYRYEGSCTKYFRCSNDGFLFVEECPVGLVYSGLMDCVADRPDGSLCRRVLDAPYIEGHQRYDFQMGKRSTNEDEPLLETTEMPWSSSTLQSSVENQENDVESTENNVTETATDDNEVTTAMSNVPCKPSVQGFVTFDEKRCVDIQLDGVDMIELRNRAKRFNGEPSSRRIVHVRTERDCTSDDRSFHLSLLLTKVSTWARLFSPIYSFKFLNESTCGFHCQIGPSNDTVVVCAVRRVKDSGTHLSYVNEVVDHLLRCIFHICTD